MNTLYLWKNERKTRLFAGWEQPQKAVDLCVIYPKDFLRWIQENSQYRPFMRAWAVKGLVSEIQKKEFRTMTWELANSLGAGMRLRAQGNLEGVVELNTWVSQMLAGKQLCPDFDQWVEQEIECLELVGQTWLLTPEQPLALYLNTPLVNLEGQEIDRACVDDFSLEISEGRFEEQSKAVWRLFPKSACTLDWDESKGLIFKALKVTNTLNTHLFAWVPPLWNVDEWKLSNAWIIKALGTDAPALGLDFSPGRAILLRKGIMPQAYEMERLELNERLFGNNPDASEVSKNEAGTFSAFREVYQGQWIGTQWPARQGRPGVDLDGRPLDLPEVMGIAAVIEGLIDCTIGSKDESIYTASSDGIVTYNEGVLRIRTHLSVDEVGLKTGAVRYSKDVEVCGLVRAGIPIDVGGNLLLWQTPEPGAVIKCAGNLICKAGLVGAMTTVEVGGDLRVNFLEDVTVQVRGNAYIVGTVVNATVHADGWVVVEGRGRSGLGKGAQIGGLVNGAKGVWLKSASSEIGAALVVSGVSLLVEKQLDQLRRRQGELGQRALKMNERIQDLLQGRGPEHLNSMERVTLKSLLENLAVLSRIKMENANRILKVEEEAAEKCNAEAKVWVTEELFPNVEIQIEGVSTRVHYHRPYHTPVLFFIRRAYLMECPEPEAAKPPIPEPRWMD